MENTLQVLTTKNFNGIEFNCYKADNAEDDFFATREQIGQLLGYDNPNNAITIIHRRNADRLNKFSTSVKMTQVEGNRTVTRDVIVYSFKGLLEICRYSNQPKANAVMDFLWDIADEIRRKGYYFTPAKAEDIIANPEEYIKVLQELVEQRKRNKVLEEGVEKLQTQAKHDRECIKMLEDHVEEVKPKVLFADAVEASKQSCLVGELAKYMRQNGVDIGEKRLYRWFRENGYLMRGKNGLWNMPTQKAMDKGLFEVKKTLISTPSGQQVRNTPKITPTGQIFFMELFLTGQAVYEGF